MMSTSTGLRVLVADLVKRPGSSRALHLAEDLGELEVGGSHLLPGGPIELDLHLERILEGLVVRGTVSTDWVGSCARCLRSVSGRLQVGVDELYEPEPIEGETYRLDHDSIDLEPLARDAIGLEMPLAPVCRPDCLGICPTCGADRNLEPCDCVADAADSPWSALDGLTFEEPPEPSTQH